MNDNSGLSKLEKFHYLRGVEGVVLDTIASLELKETNYDKVLKLLKNRIDDKLLNFRTHINWLFSLSSARKWVCC